MAASSEFIDYLRDQLAPLGVFRSRRMFGGWGLYLDELFVAIVINEVLYLKADALNQDFYQAAGSCVFSYPKKDGSSASLNFYEVPADILEDRDLLQTWVKQGKAASLRALAKK